MPATATDRHRGGSLSFTLSEPNEHAVFHPPCLFMDMRETSSETLLEGTRTRSITPRIAGTILMTATWMLQEQHSTLRAESEVGFSAKWGRDALQLPSFLSSELLPHFPTSLPSLRPVRHVRSGRSHPCGAVLNLPTINVQCTSTGITSTASASLSFAK